MHFKNDLNQSEGFKPLKIWVDNVNRILQNINETMLTKQQHENLFNTQ